MAENAGESLPKIGIVGAGQLAQMLKQAAAALNVPCVLYTGDLADESALATFFSAVDRITFENEFIDVEVFERALQRAGAKNKIVRPSLKHLGETQDKLKQKSLFHQLNIPTAEFKVLSSAGELTSWLSKNCGGWQQAILKWSRFGYDGKGNLAVTSATDLEVACVFFEEGRARGAEIYAERVIPFRRELALQATFVDGALVTFPAVVSEQKSGICHRVWGPAQSWGGSAASESHLHTYADALARKFGLEGTFAIEAFETDSGNLLVNEIAPRVHNTGHATQSVLDHSQFDLHIRAVAGLPLPIPQPYATYFAMLNILGPHSPEKLQRLSTLFSKSFFAAGMWNQPAELLPPQVHRPENPLVNVAISWYDKEPRANRKLGHINFWSDEQNLLKTALTQWEDWIYNG